MFPKLYEAIGGSYGKTSNLTFRLPDMRARVAAKGGPTINELGGWSKAIDRWKVPVTEDTRQLDPEPQFRYVIKI
jgi:microcystin-dependent protein